MLMGYYSSADFDFRINKNQVEDLRKEIKKMRLSEDKRPCFSNFLEDVKISDDGYLDYGDYYQKWYDDEDFVRFIRDYATNGTLKFCGEDSSEWGYEFSDGKVYRLEFVTQRGGLFL